jgi:hypothetical protein
MCRFLMHSIGGRTLFLKRTPPHFRAANLAFLKLSVPDPISTDKLDTHDRIDEESRY